MSKKLFVSMEDDTAVELPVEAADSNDVPAEVAEAVAGSTEQTTEIQELADQAEGAIDDAGTLEENAEVAEASLDPEGPTNGEGLDEVAAEMMAINVAAICRRLGTTKRPVPAVESFGARGSRVHATKLAVEGVWDTIVKVWENVKKAFKAIWEKIKGWWTYLTKESVRVEFAVAKMIVRVREVGSKSKLKDDAEIKSSSIAKAFQIKGATSGKAALTLTKNTAGFIKGAEAVVANFSSITRDLVEAAKSGKKADKSEAGIKSAIAGIGSGTTPDLPIVGSKYLNLSSGTDKVSTYINIQISVVADAEDFDGEDCDVLKVDEMNSLLNYAGDIVKTIQKIEKTKEIEKFNDALDKASDLIIKEAEKKAKTAKDPATGKKATDDQKNDAVQVYRDLINSFRGLGTSGQKIVQLAGSTGLGACHSVLSYVSASLNQYKQA